MNVVEVLESVLVDAELSEEVRLAELEQVVYVMDNELKDESMCGN